MKRLTHGELLQLPFGSKIKIVWSHSQYHDKDEEYNGVIFGQCIGYEDGEIDKLRIIAECLYNNFCKCYLLDEVAQKQDNPTEKVKAPKFKLIVNSDGASHGSVVNYNDLLNQVFAVYGTDITNLVKAWALQAQAGNVLNLLDIEVRRLADDMTDTKEEAPSTDKYAFRLTYDYGLRSRVLYMHYNLFIDFIRKNRGVEADYITDWAAKAKIGSRLNLHGLTIECIENKGIPVAGR